MYHVVSSCKLVLEYPKEERNIKYPRRAFPNNPVPIAMSDAIIRLNKSSTPRLISLSSREGLDRSLGEERYFSFACLSSALNPFFPQAFDESAKSIYRTDRDYRAHPADGARSVCWSDFCRVMDARRTMHRDATAWSCVRVRVCFGPHVQLLVLRIHERRTREKARTAGNYRSFAFTLKRPTVGDGMHLP